MQSISIVGIGRLGGALALALSKAGYRIDNLVYRSRPVPEEVVGRISPQPHLVSFRDLDELRSDIVFITSADPEIESISSQLAARVKNSPLVFHTSGSLSSGILSGLADAGFGTGSMHPLISVSDPIRGSEQFAGAYFCIEGRDDATAAAKAIVTDLGGESFSIEPQFKPLYHASAVTASGHLVALVDTASEMLSNCGVEPAMAKRILMPLIKSTVTNLDNQSNREALTGTFARADIAAFERHMDALNRSASSEMRRVYLELGMRSLALADHHGNLSERSHELEKRIKLALQSGR